MEGEAQFLKKFKSTDSDRNALSSLQTYLTTHLRKWLVFAVLLLQLLFLSLVRTLPVSTPSATIPVSVGNPVGNESSISMSPAPPSVLLPSRTVAVTSPDVCDSGKVYVYDLPPMFNKELLENCDDLNPWGSRCKMLVNDGFGLKARDLAGILPEELKESWYATDQFSAEVIFHNRMLGHRCRTLNPDSATAFFIPFYGGLAVGKYLWSNYSARERDRHCETLLKWLQEQSFWRRKQGWDHFLMLGRITWDFRRSKDEDWGGSLLYMPAMKNVTRLLIERNPWDEFDVGVPYPTGFHPSTDDEVRKWQDYIRNQNRKTLFCFAGATRASIKNDFRALLLKHCKESGNCRSVNCTGTQCSNSTAATLELFLDSDFCLQPRGDSFTRRSIFDCLVAGSIPVFFWRRTAYWQYQWHLPEDPESYSVFINRTDVIKNGVSIHRVLQGLGEDKIRRMRETIIDFLPRFIYAAPREGLGNTRDAFDVSVDGIFRRFQQQRFY